jgi:preprotein translocase subunit YajC
VQFVIIMALMLGVMYVLMIRPQRQRQAQQQSMIDNAGIGDDILTSGGIYGTITQVEGEDVVVELAPNLTVHMTRRGIAAVLPPEEDAEDAEDEEYDADDEDAADDGPVLEANADGDESAVTDGEEAVRTGVGDAAAEGHRR